MFKNYSNLKDITNVKYSKNLNFAKINTYFEYSLIIKNR